MKDGIFCLPLSNNLIQAESCKVNKQRELRKKANINIKGPTAYQHITANRKVGSWKENIIRRKLKYLAKSSNKESGAVR